MFIKTKDALSLHFAAINPDPGIGTSKKKGNGDINVVKNAKILKAHNQKADKILNL